MFLFHFSSSVGEVHILVRGKLHSTFEIAAFFIFFWLLHVWIVWFCCWIYVIDIKHLLITVKFPFALHYLIWYPHFPKKKKKKCDLLMTGKKIIPSQNSFILSCTIVYHLNKSNWLNRVAECFENGFALIASSIGINWTTELMSFGCSCRREWM